MPPTPNALLRLRKHADYQRVYAATRKQHARQMSFFYALRPPLGPDGKARRSPTPGPRIGLTVGKVLGKAHERNRIKRRLRELIRAHAPLLAAWPVDVILHPRRTALDMDHARLDREVRDILQQIARELSRPNQRASHPPRSAPPVNAAVVPPSRPA